MASHFEVRGFGRQLLADNRWLVIPGRRAATSPEPMNTASSGKPLTLEINSSPSVCMASGPRPPDDPGMTSSIAQNKPPSLPSSPSAAIPPIRAQLARERG